MRLNKATHYGLYAALEMARLGHEGTVTVAEVATRHDLPEGVLAKVFQQLARTGIAVGTRGVGGGYRLARDSSEVSVLDVIDALESPVTGTGGSDALSASAAGLHRLFSEVDDLARATFASTSLETLAR
jgi:Rrf2 family iron-sulfur cluster assembly transcriptional regulator